MEVNWYKLVISTKTIEPATIDLISHYLFEMGSLGVEVDYAQGYLENHLNVFGEIVEEPSKERLEHDTEIIAYFDQVIEIESICQWLATDLGDPSAKVAVSQQADEKWQNNWMAYYQPESISRFLTIVPEWYADQYQRRADEQIIILDPGVAFGTGNHPTTQLGAHALEIVLRGGETVLDVGTGSGILAFVAKALGAKEIYGYDLDPQAVESAQRNLLLQQNNEHIEFAVNDLLKGINHCADIIIANILPHILVDLLDDAYRLLKEDGWLILGGILSDKSETLEQILKEKQWQLIQKMILKDWVCLMVKKQGDA